MPPPADPDDDLARLLPDVAALAEGLDGQDYLTDLGLATALFLAVRLPQPLLLEGEPGVGKTEAAKALARLLDTPLYRLQCYEGIDAAEALYEWDHPRQLLGIRLAEARHDDVAESDLYRADYLLRRPLLQAIEHPGPRPAVLLLDEIDRAGAEFEAFTFGGLAGGWVDAPPPERGAEVVRRRVPGSEESLAVSAAAAVGRLRSLDMVKPPGIAEV